MSALSPALTLYDPHWLTQLVGLTPGELARREMVTRDDLAVIRQMGFAAWVVMALGDLPRPQPLPTPCPPQLYQFLAGEVSACLGMGIAHLKPVERVGRILLLEVLPRRTSDPPFALVLCPPASARVALRSYASAFEYFEHPSAWITDATTTPAYRLERAEQLLINGGGLGFSRSELAYLLTHIRYLLSQTRY